MTFDEVGECEIVGDDRTLADGEPPIGSSRIGLKTAAFSATKIKKCLL